MSHVINVYLIWIKPIQLESIRYQQNTMVQPHHICAEIAPIRCIWICAWNLSLHGWSKCTTSAEISCRPLAVALWKKMGGIYSRSKHIQTHHCFELKKYFWRKPIWYWGSLPNKFSSKIVKPQIHHCAAFKFLPTCQPYPIFKCSSVSRFLANHLKGTYPPRPYHKSPAQCCWA